MIHLFRSIPVFLLIAFASLAGAQDARPVPAVARVLIISVDGMRPDVMLRADTPALRGLMAGGCFSLYAATTDVAITLPSHTSMLTGVTPDKHGILYNSDDIPDGAPRFPLRPTLFELAKKAGYTTALIAGKSKFETLARPGACDVVLVPPAKQKFSDEQVGDNAVTTLQKFRPQVMFVHFPGADNVGHGVGWGAPQQVEILGKIDLQIGRIVQALDALNLRDQTLIIVSADHGGSGLQHGANDPRSHFIPWIANGPGLLKDYDLTRFRDLTVHTEDTFATACFVLGISTGQDIDGRPVKRMFPALDLIQETPQATTKPVG